MRNAARILLTVLRAGVPVALLAGGIASLVYGIGHHAVEVSVEHEIEIDLTPPPGVEPPGWDGFGPPGFVPPGEGFGPPDAGFGEPAMGVPPPWLALPPELAKIKDKVILTEATSEPTLIREVTFGGVKRLSSGVLWRTYTGDPPSLCPT
jgi:hypothetical protein